jgi:hypothetical protein
LCIQNLAIKTGEDQLGPYWHRVTAITVSSFVLRPVAEFSSYN